jgi:molecular chaperone GrpE
MEPLPDVDVAALMEERDRFKDQLLRARAEFDNYRKRMERDADRLRKTAAASVIHDLLPVLDNLERALEHANDESGGLAQGVEMVLKQMHEVLARHGVGPISTVGKPFTPDLHEAMMMMESAEVPPGHVTQEFQKGYRMGERVLRHAKVAVSAAPPESAAPETEKAPGESRTPDAEHEE